MPPTTPNEKQRAARRVEVQELLRDQELTIPRWCALALEQSEIKTLHVAKYTDAFLSRNTRVPYDVNRGADLDHIEGLITEKYGPGTYLFSAVGSDGRYWARKGVSLGVTPDPPAGALPPPMPENPEMTLDATMKAALLRRQVRGFMTDEDNAETTKQLAPMKMLTEMLTILKPSGDGATEKLLAYVMQENAETKRLLMEILTKGQGTRQDDRDPMGTSIETLDRVMAIAGKLGMSKSEGGGGSMWTPEAISTIVATAAPLLKESLATLRAAMGHGARAAGAVVDGTVEYVQAGAQAVAHAVGPSGPEGARMVLSEIDKELVEIGYAALTTKDFQTVEMAYNAIRPLSNGFLPELNPDVNPALYVNLMRRFDARFDLVRAEWAMFLLWLKEQENLSQAEVETGGEPAARDR
jgi:hypothetical protein